METNQQKTTISSSVRGIGGRAAGTRIPKMARNYIMDKRTQSPDITEETGQEENWDVSAENVRPDSPLDLTVPVSKKRKLADSDLTNWHSQTKIWEQVKRIRPSVISFAERERSANADPDEHFFLALGPRVYNMIYGNVRGRRRAMEDRRCALSRTEISTGGNVSVDDHFKKSLGEKTWMEVQGY